ncbi:MAG: hypothetical protein JWM47_3770, partial [Acidimicrobiales bacterium]|nr:hypothetical protein [Acidimicrobiales bacterium]
MQKVDAWGTKGQEGNGSSSGWTFRWAGGVVVAVAAMVGVLVSAACTDERGAPSPSAVARDRPLTGGVLSSVAGVPGTPLGDGIELAEGTVLIGDPIQTRQSRGDGAGREVVAVTGWEATSLIDGGDPVAIIEDYLAQARALGLTDQADRGCVLDGDVTFCSA